MALTAIELKNERIAEILEMISGRFDKKQAADLSLFVEKLYERVAADDILSIQSENLYGSALSLYKFAGEREPNTVKIRTFSPTLEEHGWKTSHTVIEIVNDDMPFLVDSVTAALTQRGLNVHVLIHPVLCVKRDKKGSHISFEKTENGGKQTGLPESIMHIEVDEQSSPDDMKEIEATLYEVLDDVRAAVEDWKSVLAQVDKITKSLKPGSMPLEDAEVEEGKALLEWMADNHFTFLGFREYKFKVEDKNNTENWEPVPGSGLGILRNPERRIMSGKVEVSPEVSEFLHRPELIIVTKANARSTVHRPVQLDYVGVKKFNKKGEVVGEYRFTGLFTSAAYNRIPRDIPYLRRKVQQTLEKSGFAKSSHDEKALAHILETYPRDELFQISIDELYDISCRILELQERPRIAAFLRRDRFERFVSALVYVPRERYNTEIRQSFAAILAEMHSGEISAHYSQVGDDVLARIHFIISLNPGQTPDVDEDVLEQRLVAAAREWSDDLNDALLERWGEVEALRLKAKYGDAFPVGYRARFNANLALRDIEKLEEVSASGEVGLNLYRWVEDPDNRVRFKIYNLNDPMPLSDCLPMIENMGLKVLSENPYFAKGENLENGIWIHDFELEEPDGHALDLHLLKIKFEETFLRVWQGTTESDMFNRLVLRCNLSWSSVAVLRAYAKYLRQAGVTFSQSYMARTLYDNSAISNLLVDLFHVRFDPDYKGKRNADIEMLRQKIQEELEQVDSLDDDRILRRYLNLIEHTLRTNFFQEGAGEADKPYFSFKLDSQNITDLPLPRPYREIFVYSPRVEGVHLRGGSVARGGLRWSDRREDFRTEILGLMKAQMVKNTVIVPVGSKGGFYPKNLPVGGSREEIQAEGIACYKIFISGLLDVTDNLVGGHVVAPSRVIRHDDDDPYLVVAADKGTATFSDIANEVAISYGFWLGDAFASGGAAGYDHKKMAITARGAWESVKRHFRELGKNIQEEDFTVAGIGDMSGDVFGNGMLLSRHIKLVAAFDHRNIFIDPTPDAEQSFKERERMFALPRSSWEDYDAKLISKGGGVFDRKAKSITLTPEIMELLDVKEKAMTPNDLISAILKANVDLLWFGGIGTYVKSKQESNAEVGDRANDAIRITGNEVRAKVIGEGGNLGVTQFGRIEYALSGGKLNTDAIDNSAGVDCSDHEVNIKILLRAVLDDGEMTDKQRDRLLSDMTDDVAEHVLKDNYLQTQALTTAERQSIANFEEQVRFMKELEKQGRLDRVVENLPDEEVLADRRSSDQGLTRPETSVLLAYAKMTLYSDVLDTELPDDPFFVSWLEDYFPPQLRKKYKKYIASHRLRREIITTIAINSLVNRAGLTFVMQMVEELGVGVDDVVRAYVLVAEVFNLQQIWGDIEALDNVVDSQVQGRMIDATQMLLRRATLWCLRHLSFPIAISDNLKELAPAMKELETELEGLLSPEGCQAFRDRVQYFVGMKVPEPLARRVASLAPLRSSLDVVQVGRNSKRDIPEVGEVYYAVGAGLNLDWLRFAAEGIEPENHWERLAVTAIIDDLYGQQRALTNTVFSFAGDHKGIAAFEHWQDENKNPVRRCKELIEEFKAAGSVDVSKLAFANRQFRSMIS
ncbi:NAD-glutamate dehydrogenase [Sneathiella sp. P13V-1]|uniref:NAD-glutamate dehydrogenase n=1 Tax=Sneathiella sp. P13V-1 TaxID=2697366 RepID=UPI00187B4849|nr:NAD-glutamate dehydrogenase [Sneathiella sp. P13V-1]MBE7636231.1 NAD-glutamate dehydrogenase [Sneathiella sp. P13V-1]